MSYIIYITREIIHVIKYFVFYINMGKANQELQTITGKLELACESITIE
jgi:hypothetical protein